MRDAGDEIHLNEVEERKGFQSSFDIIIAVFGATRVLIWGCYVVTTRLLLSASRRTY